MKPETFTLLVWQMVPESTGCYMIPNSVANQYREVFTEAHGELAGYDDSTDSPNFLNDTVSDTSYDDDGENIIHAHTGIFREFKLDNNAPIADVHITHVCVSGIML